MARQPVTPAACNNNSVCKLSVYEEYRSWFIERSAAFHLDQGLGLFLSRGMCAWLELDFTDPNYNIKPVSLKSPDIANRNELVAMLASMVGGR